MESVKIDDITSRSWGDMIQVQPSGGGRETNAQSQTGPLKAELNRQCYTAG